MGNGQPQQPRTQFPQAEFFALAPGRNIALGPRLFATTASSPVTSVPASGVAAAQPPSLTLDPNFGFSSAIYLVRSYLLFVPSDASGFLTITQARMGMGGSSFMSISLDIGIPTATFSAPPNPLVAIYERDALITQIELPNVPLNGPLVIWGQVSAKNTDGAAAHTFAVGLFAVWHRLNGFVQ